MNWPRQYYRSGGGDAFLFYVVYGSVPQDFTISGPKYRVDNIPEELEIMFYGPTSHPEVVSTFRSGYLWEEFGRKHAELAEEVGSQSECLVIKGTIPNPLDLNYLRNVVGIITWCLDRGGLAVFDTQTFRWWTPSEWMRLIFEPALAEPTHHVMIFFSEDEDEVGSEWFHTRGMLKFGRPDLSVHGVTTDLRDAVIDLINRFIAFQAFGGIIEEGREIKMPSLPPGICTHQGDMDDPDFNNVHVEIKFSNE